MSVKCCPNRGLYECCECDQLRCMGCDALVVPAEGEQVEIKSIARACGECGQQRYCTCGHHSSCHRAPAVDVLDVLGPKCGFVSGCECTGFVLQ